MTEKNQKLQEMQMLEQNLQNILLQKQAFQMELSETDSSLGEFEKSGDEVYKVIGQLMIKTEKSRMKEELLNKKKVLELRINSLEKQEKSLTEQAEKIRDEVLKSKK